MKNKSDDALRDAFHAGVWLTNNQRESGTCQMIYGYVPSVQQAATIKAGLEAKGYKVTHDTAPTNYNLELQQTVRPDHAQRRATSAAKAFKTGMGNVPLYYVRIGEAAEGTVDLKGLPVNGAKIFKKNPIPGRSEIDEFDAAMHEMAQASAQRSAARS
jgi:hypothetical protein